MILINKGEKKEIKGKIDKMSGDEFENYLFYMFLELGYKVEKTPCSGDYGADLIVIKEKIKTVVQAKRYNSCVSLGAVQEILGAKGYYDADEALVVTNNFYTTSAKNLAKKNNVKLWDRGHLFSMIISDERIEFWEREIRKKEVHKKKKRNNSFNRNIDVIIDTIFKQ